MEEIIFVVKESEIDGGFIAESLVHGIVTQSETWEELKVAVKDAINCHFDEEHKKIIRLHLVKQEVFTS